MISQELLKGSLKTLVLKLLADNGRMYGYEITKRVEQLSRGNVQLTWGALYPTLHKLEADGLIVAEEVKIGKRVRKYYKLTPKGNETSALKIEDFIEYVNTMKDLLSLKPVYQLA